MEFEEKINRVKEILEKLNSDELSLNDGMELYKEGTQIIKEAQKELEEAQIKYKEIKNLSQENTNEDRK